MVTTHAHPFTCYRLPARLMTPGSWHGSAIGMRARLHCCLAHVTVGTHPTGSLSPHASTGRSVTGTTSATVLPVGIGKAGRPCKDSGGRTSQVRSDCITTDPMDHTRLSYTPAGQAVGRTEQPRPPSLSTPYDARGWCRQHKLSKAYRWTFAHLHGLIRSRRVRRPCVPWRSRRSPDSCGSGWTGCQSI